MKWKFVRTRLWMYYVSEASPLPPPFNLVPVEKAATGVRWLARRYRWTNAVSQHRDCLFNSTSSGVCSNVHSCTRKYPLDKPRKGY